MKNLKNMGVKVPRTTTVCSFFGEEQTLTIDDDIRSKFNGCFAVNNSTLCYIIDNEVFVAPYTEELMNDIEAAGMTEKYFYVPFSNGDYPKYEAERWKHLKDAAMEARYREHEVECAEWCDKHGIFALSEDTMKRCFKMPRNGVPVRHLYFETTYYPVCEKTCIDAVVADNLGHWCCNNGRVVFVYRDGHTYVAKGYWILDELREAGFKESSLFVPFSNGEQITDPYLADLWEQVTKK